MAETSLQRAITIAAKATEEDRQGNYEEALRNYSHACEYFMHALKHECQSEKQKETIRGRLEGYVDRAEQVKKYLLNNTDPL